MKHQLFFDRITVISLPSRPERLRAFRDGWYAEARRVDGKTPLCPTATAALDGNRLPVPPDFTHGPGAWGCLRSHLGVLEKALAEGRESVLVFEDDAAFSPHFFAWLELFLAAVPDDWDGLMLGGEHVDMVGAPPLPVRRNMVQCVNTHRTHAYAVRGRLLRELYLAWAQNTRHHCDWVLATLQPQFRVYAPQTWLVGQRAGMSDVSGRQEVSRLWGATCTSL